MQNVKERGMSFWAAISSLATMRNPRDQKMSLGLIWGQKKVSYIIHN